MKLQFFAPEGDISQHVKEITDSVRVDFAKYAEKEPKKGQEAVSK